MRAHSGQEGGDSRSAGRHAPCCLPLVGIAHRSAVCGRRALAGSPAPFRSLGRPVPGVPSARSAVWLGFVHSLRSLAHALPVSLPVASRSARVRLFRTRASGAPAGGALSISPVTPCVVARPRPAVRCSSTRVLGALGGGVPPSPPFSHPFSVRACSTLLSRSATPHGITPPSTGTARVLRAHDFFKEKERKEPKERKRKTILRIVVEDIIKACGNARPFFGIFNSSSSHTQ